MVKKELIVYNDVEGSSGGWEAKWQGAGDGHDNFVEENMEKMVAAIRWVWTRIDGVDLAMWWQWEGIWGDGDEVSLDWILVWKSDYSDDGVIKEEDDQPKVGVLRNIGCYMTSVLPLLRNLTMPTFFRCGGGGGGVGVGIWLGPARLGPSPSEPARFWQAWVKYKEIKRAQDSVFRLFIKRTWFWLIILSPIAWWA